MCVDQIQGLGIAIGGLLGGSVMFGYGLWAMRLSNRAAESTRRYYKLARQHHDRAFGYNRETVAKVGELKKLVDALASKS